MHHQSGFLPEPVAKIQKTLELCAVVGKKNKNMAQNLEDNGKMPIFAASKHYFGYPGRIPRGQAVYVTTQFIKPYSECAALIFIRNSSSSFSGIPYSKQCYA